MGGGIGVGVGVREGAHWHTSCDTDKRYLPHSSQPIIGEMWRAVAIHDQMNHGTKQGPVQIEPAINFLPYLHQ